MGIGLPQTAHIYCKISQVWTLHSKPQQQCLVPITAAAVFESRRDPSAAKHRAGRTAVPSACCDAVPIRREALQRRIKYDAILCSLLGGYEDVWLNNLQRLLSMDCMPRLQFYARTWQQRANREDRISAVHPQTGSESLRNGYRCANCEKQIN